MDRSWSRQVVEVKLEFIEVYIVPLWRTVACAAVLCGRRANTVAGRRRALPSACFGSWEGRRGRRVESVEWRGLLGCVYDIAGVGGRSSVVHISVGSRTHDNAEYKLL